MRHLTQTPARIQKVEPPILDPILLWCSLQKPKTDLLFGSFPGVWVEAYDTEGPSTQYLRTLLPKTIPLVAFGARVLKYWVLGSSG